MSQAELIKEILGYHPGYNAGIKRKWSTYVGGMQDTGQWYISELLNASHLELCQCLSELIEESKPPPPLSPEDVVLQKQIIVTPNGATNALEQKHMTEIMQRQEAFMLWGNRKS